MVNERKPRQKYKKSPVLPPNYSLFRVPQGKNNDSETLILSSLSPFPLVFHNLLSPAQKSLRICIVRHWAKGYFFGSQTMKTLSKCLFFSAWAGDACVQMSIPTMCILWRTHVYFIGHGSPSLFFFFFLMENACTKYCTFEALLDNSTFNWIKMVCRYGRTSVP